MSEPWTTPFDRQVEGGLRGMMSQQSDGHTTILRPRRFPTATIPPAPKELFDPITPAPPCDPADGFDIFADPFSNPFNIGDSFTLAVDGLFGTLPITFAWTLNGSPAGTTETIFYTVSDGDITGKDASGLGSIAFAVVLKNACNTTGTTLSGFFAAQGTPP